MKIITIDPSSTRTGYAVLMDDDITSMVHDAGYLRPARQRDDAFTRIQTMGDDLAELVDDLRPVDFIVIETTTGKVNKRRHGGGGSGLGVYGMAVGYLIKVAEVSLKCRDRVIRIDEGWTRGISKRKRQAQCAAQFPAYAGVMADDQGGDVSDAIGLGCYFMTCRTAGEYQR